MKTTFCCLAGSPGELPVGEPAFIFDDPALVAPGTDIAAIVLRNEPEARARVLLERGAAKILLGEAALLDSGVVERLVAHYGGERVGLCVPVRRMAVSWSFETVSNADFKVVAPSLGQPSWEILRADGSGSGTLADWWIGEMVSRGVQTVLLRADIVDDADLNLCAGMAESLGARLWVTPLSAGEAAIEDWIAYGQARQIALPPALFAQRERWLTPDDAGAAHEAAGVDLRDVQSKPQ